MNRKTLSDAWEEGAVAMAQWALFNRTGMPQNPYKSELPPGRIPLYPGDSLESVRERVRQYNARPGSDDE